MNITEVRCLQTSTHLLGTILHLDDVIGTFAGRNVAMMSDSLAVTLLSVATRVAVTAALIFVEFGILSMYSPLLTGALIIGMYFYPVPVQTIAPIRPPMPPVGAEPPPLISGTLPDIFYPPEEITSPVRVPAPVSVPTSPTSTPVSPYRPPGSSFLNGSHPRLPRPDSLVRRTLVFDDLTQAPSGTPLSTSMITQPTPRVVDEGAMSRSAIMPPSRDVFTTHRRTNSTGSQLNVEQEVEVPGNDDEDLSSSGSSGPPSPTVIRQIPPVSSLAAVSSTLTHRHVTTTPPSSTSVVDHSIQSHQGPGAKDFLIVVFTQALGDDLGPFFVNKMLPPNITSAEYNSATQNFSFTLSDAKETAIARVGACAIEGVQGCTLKIHNVVRGSLDNDLQGISFQDTSMQMSGTKLFVPYTVTLVGLRRNYDESITLRGNHWSGKGNVTGTADQFRDTFSYINWNT